MVYRIVLSTSLSRVSAPTKAHNKVQTVCPSFLGDLMNRCDRLRSSLIIVYLAGVSNTGGQQYNSGQQGGQNRPSCRLPWLLHDQWQMMTDLVSITVNHDEVVRTAQNHGSGDSSLFSNAMGFINDNQVVVICWHAKERCCLKY